MLLAVATLGDDRPGIIAAVSAVLLRAGCNIEESAMTRLRGEFAMMLVVESPLGPDEVQAQLQSVAETLGLVVNVRPAAEQVGSPGDSAFSVSVYGADHPGIVHAITSLLASRQVNVVDVVTHVLSRDSDPVYVMVLEVSVPAGTDTDELSAALAELAAAEGIDASITAVDPETL